MTVCQFFLQGRCRYGQNCKFEHAFNNEDRSNRNTINSQQLSNVVKQMVEEVILVEKGGQWPLSSFSPVRGGPSIPGWEDVSPEEVRWKMYEARANGNLNQCIHEINQMYSNAEKMRNLIKEPTMERVNLIVNLLKGKREPSNPSNQFSNSSSSTNIFGGSPQSIGSQNIFRNSTPVTGSHGSIFGGSSSPSSGNVFGGSSQPNTNIFGGSTGFSNQNIFGGSSSSNAFSQNTFTSPQNSSQNLFSSSSSGNNNMFSNVTVSSKNIFSNAGEGNNQNVSNAFLPSNSSGIFSNQASSNLLFSSNSTFSQNSENQKRNQSNIFSATQNENTENTFNNTSNIFNIPQQNTSKSLFGNEAQQNSFSNKEFDSSVYSKLEDLNEEEIKSFTSATFIFGKIPLKPPPKEYCK